MGFLHGWPSCNDWLKASRRKARWKREDAVSFLGCFWFRPSQVGKNSRKRVDACQRRFARTMASQQ
jgi:hypothetical protein